MEILARFLGTHTDADIDDIIHELPLRQWKDVAGSKLRPHHFLVAACELWTIRREQSRSKSGGVKRQETSRRWYDWNRTNPVAIPQSTTTPLQP